jgi:hypothetical protein
MRRFDRRHRPPRGDYFASLGEDLGIRAATRRKQHSGVFSAALTRIIHGEFGFGVLGLGMGALAEGGSLAA